MSNTNKRKNFLIKLAFKNVFTHTWMNMKLCFVFASLTFLICLFSVYNLALTERKNESFNQAIAANYAFLDGEITDEIQKIIDDNFSKSEYEYLETQSIDIRKRVSDSNSYTSLFTKYLVVEANNQKHSSNSSTVRGVAFNKGIFIEDDYTEMKTRFGYDTLHIGKMPENENEMLLSKQFLDEFKLNDKNYIGETISIYIRNEETPILTAKLTGIIREEFQYLSGHSTYYKPGIILDDNHPIFYSTIGKMRTNIFFNKWLNEDKVALIESVGFHYAGKGLLSSITMLDNIQTIANNLYYIIGTSIFIGLILIIFLMIGKYIQLFSKTSGIFLTFGLEKKKMYWLLFLQLMIVCLFALPLSLFLTISSYHIINMLLTSFKNINMGISMLRFFEMFSIGIITVTLLAAIFFIYGVFKLKGQTIKQYLTTEIR